MAKCRKDKKTIHFKEINDFLYSYFKKQFKTYFSEKKHDESSKIFNTTLVSFYPLHKIFIIKMYILFVRFTGKGYNYRYKFIS